MPLFSLPSHICMYTPKRHMRWRRNVFLFRERKYNVTILLQFTQLISHKYTIKDRIPIQRLRPKWGMARHVRRRHGSSRRALHSKRHARITFWYRAFECLYTSVQETSCVAGWCHLPSASSAFSTPSIWETTHVDFLSVLILQFTWFECW